jgi:methionyl-tRNA formyltransferase
MRYPIEIFTAEICIFLKMKITILSDAGSWKNAAIGELAGRLRKKHHRVALLHKAETAPRGDILFILGFFKIVPGAILKKNKTNIVVHESALPKGRGWSPMSWLVLEGAKEIPLTLFEAVEKVDAGRIYLRSKVKLKGHELLPEIRRKAASAMMRLCEEFVDSCPSILARGVEQRGKPSYYRRRSPEDSRLDPHKSIAAQFNLLRIADNESYPAFFDHRGATYLLKIEKKNR